MYDINSDLHTHTSVSVHAYSTLTDNVREAKKKRLFAIAKTDHGPKLGDAPSEWHFGGIMTIATFIDGIRIYRGVEANILGHEGRLDLNENLLKRYEWVIASIHDWQLGGEENYDKMTSLWLNIANNKAVDCIGHCGGKRYMFDYERVIKEFAQNGKIVEINNHSFEVREGSHENCIKIAQLCKKYGVYIAVTSDAHCFHQIGYFRYTLELLEEISFPKELIINEGTIEKIEKYINGKSSKL